MASIGTEKNGRRRVLFVSSDGRRKTLRLCEIGDSECGA